MNESIFRKKSLEKISSPEKNDEYMRVTRPGVLLIICAVIMLIVAILSWSLVSEKENDILRENENDIVREIGNDERER